MFCGGVASMKRLSDRHGFSLEDAGAGYNPTCIRRLAYSPGSAAHPLEGSGLAQNTGIV